MSDASLIAFAARTVLIVDDTPANLALLVNLLEGQGLCIAVAQDGEEALARAALLAPELILLDVMLPGINGFEVCRRLKAMPVTVDTPVIFMTALDGSADKVTGFAAGGVDYVTKPLQVDEVLARVATHLRLAQMQRQLMAQNALLETENRERRQAESALQRYRASLEQQVAARTAALRDGERRFRTLGQNLPDAIVRYDRALQRVYVNPAFEAALEQSWRAGMPASAFERAMRTVLATGKAADVGLHYDNADGSRRDVAIRMVAEYGPDGAIDGVLAIGRDVTAEKQAGRELEASYAQMRALEAHRETVREDERKRIARELHDELGQFLTALRMSCAMLRVRFGKQAPGLNEHVRDMTELVDRTIAVVRNVATTLRPAALDLGIGSALEWLAEEFGKHSGIACDLQLDLDGVELDESRAIAVFRIVQESLTNVARHAGATEVRVALRAQGRACRLEVSDNGKGFDPERGHAKTFGLLGIRERVNMLGGRIAVRSVPGSGTSIEVSIPSTGPDTPPAS